MLVVALIIAITVIMACRSELDAFSAHISTLTTDNPHVDPIAVERFRNSIAAVKYAIEWFMAKSTDEAHQTLTTETRAIVRQLATDIVRASDYVMDQNLLEAWTRTVDYGYIDSDMRMLYRSMRIYMAIADINAQLPRLFRFLLIATTIIAKYKMRVANAAAHAVFFGVGERDAVCSASEMLTALATMDVDLELAHLNCNCIGLH